MSYRIESTAGSDHYNDPTQYVTLEEAERELAEVQVWAAAEAKREPSWENATFRVVEDV